MEVRVEKGRVRVGEHWASLLSGSVHYWRLHPNSWQPILCAVRDMGLETVESYVPWQYHELAPGVYDFLGDTDSRRNLVGYLQLTKEMGFWLIVRPGPFIYSEWVNMGVPTDVAAYHRLHATFTTRAAEYIRAVSRVIAPFQATRGGHVVMLQPDNEADTFEYCYEEQLGLSSAPGLFQEFMQEKYGDVSLLNERWGTRYETFADARAFMNSLDLTPEYLIRYLDFVEFRGAYIDRCVAHYAAEYRSNGIDIPLCHNTYDIYGVQNSRSLAKVVDLVGLDGYPCNEFASKSFATGDELGHRRLQEIFRYPRTFSDTAYIAEYEAGIAHGLHYYSGVLLPNHVTLTNLTAIQAGVQAWNWYMLVNRDNWMMSPINEWGRRQLELFDVYAEMVQIYVRMDPPSLDKITNTSALFYLKHQMVPGANSEPTLTALYGAGVEYEFYDAETGYLRKPCLFYTGPGWLDRAHQERLAAYVEDGGHLVFFQTLPLRDDTFGPCNALGLVEPVRATNEPFLDHLATETEVCLGPRCVRTRAPFFVYEGNTPGQPIIGHRVDAPLRDTGFEENRYLRSLVISHDYQVGYHERRGRGSVTVVGIRPSAGAVQAVHEFLNVPVPIYSHTPTVKPALFRRGGTWYAVLLNIGDYPVRAALDIAPGLLGRSAYRATSLRRSVPLETDTLVDGRLTIQLPRKNGTVIEIS